MLYGNRRKQLGFRIKLIVLVQSPAASSGGSKGLLMHRLLNPFDFVSRDSGNGTLAATTAHDDFKARLYS